VRRPSLGLSYLAASGITDAAQPLLDDSEDTKRAYESAPTPPAAC